MLSAHRNIITDYKKIAILAYPVVLSNAVDTLMMMVDRMFLARVNSAYGSEVLLGGAMGGAVIVWLMVAPLQGLLLYTNAMAAQNFGRGNLPRCAQVAAQAMYWALAYYPVMLLFSRSVPSVLRWMGHAEALATAEWDYASILIYGCIFALLRIPLNSFFIASNRSSLVMKMAFLGMLLNIPLDYIFIFDVAIGPQSLGLQNLGLNLGNWSFRPSDWGIPTGIGGAAIATVSAQILVFLLLLLRFLREERVYKVFEAWRFRWYIHAELLHFGLPASLEGFLSSFSFNIFLMLFNSLGPLVAAAGTITFSWDLCNFIVLLGIGTATTTLVGQSLGSGNVAQAKRYTRLILWAALAFSGFVSLFFIFIPDLLSGVFITEATQNSQDLLNLSRVMLRLAAIYLLADALGVVMRGALNGSGDTFAVMLISISTHLFLLLGSILVLKVFHLSVLELWGFFIVFVMLANGIFALRYASNRWTKNWA